MAAKKAIPNSEKMKTAKWGTYSFIFGILDGLQVNTEGEDRRGPKANEDRFILVAV